MTPADDPTRRDPRKYNRDAWDRQVALGNRWTQPVGPEVITAARRGELSILLTPMRPVPREWFPPLAGAEVLGLASGGGQQCPVFAAAGARVTVFDNSPAQLARDRDVAEREGLSITTIEGDMRDLGALADQSFDLVFHPCSNSFVPEVEPVWREVYRVLRPGGTLLAGFTNPAAYLFDDQAAARGELRVRFTLPYADPTSLSAEELRVMAEAGEPWCFSHSLDTQIGGQARAGLRLLDLYEDGMENDLLSRHMPHFVATRARRD